eukprot:4372352-Prymnesium_polylepis.1
MSENGFNPSRLGDYLIKSDSTPDEVKEAVARKMKSKVAKDFVAELDKKRKAGDTMFEQLHATRKEMRPQGAQQKQDARDETITKYIAADPTSLE